METHEQQENTKKFLEVTEQRILEKVKKEFADMKLSEQENVEEKGGSDETDANGAEAKKSNGKEVVVAVIDKMNVLFTSGMGLVAALAWNEAVKDLFDRVFADQDKNSTWAKFGYAFVVTIIIVLVTYRLTKLLEKLKKDEKKDKEEEKIESV